VAAVLAILLCWMPATVRAQSAPAEIEVRLTGARGEPLADARVFISGASTASALTPRDGILRFTDVDPGLYRLRVVLAGYVTVDVNDVEALAGRRRVVEVRLDRVMPRGASATPAPAASPQPGSLAEIGRVRALAPVVQSTVDVDEGSPVRRISENLADALDKLGGVSVSQDQQFGTLSISLRNADPSRTIATAGGVPLAGGGAGQLQAIAADLSTGVSAQNGGIRGVGGAVNFRTLEPSNTWQAQTSASYGGYERSSMQVSLSGSRGKLGIALQHAVRGGNNPLTGLRFEDASGETYVHDGSYFRTANFVKLRYPVGHLTLTGGMLQGDSRSSPLCDQFVTALPCGYGPGAAIRSSARAENFGAQGQIGNVILDLTASGNASSVVDDERNRVVGGIPSPYRSDNGGSGFGVYFQGTVAIRRHTLLVNAGSYAGQWRTIATGRFQGVSINPSRWGYTVVGDTLKFSDRWSASIGYGANVSAAETRRAADLAVTLTPSNRETLSFGFGNYSNGAFSSGGGTFADPAGAQYDCAAQEVTVSGPGDAASAGSLTSASLFYSRRGRRGTMRVSAYDRIDRGGNLNAQFPLLALPPGTIPPGYVATVGAFWQAGTICGSQPFDPARVYVTQDISGVTVRYRGFDASGQIVLGRSVIALPSYSVNGAALVSSDPRLLYSGSPFFVGSQLPYRPLHKASLLVDAVQRRAALEWVVNGTWVSGNNQNSLGSYVQVAAGVTWTAKRGRLTLFANNLFNTDTALFATQQFAAPLLLRGGGTYTPVPVLLPPRAYTLLYSVRAGRSK
jgi:hypothetical protein